jgi:hypothetical protein
MLFAVSRIPYIVSRKLAASTQIVIFVKTLKFSKKTHLVKASQEFLEIILFFNRKPSILIKLLDRHVFMQARNWCNASQSLVF